MLWSQHKMLPPPWPGCVTVAKEDPSLDSCMTGVDVKHSDAYAAAPSLGADFFGADFFRGAFGANSKPTFPFSSLRCAEKGRPFLEMNLWSKSVLPVAINFCTCSFGISRCKMCLLMRKLQVFGEAMAFSHA